MHHCIDVCRLFHLVRSLSAAGQVEASETSVEWVPPAMRTCKYLRYCYVPTPTLSGQAVPPMGNRQLQWTCVGVGGAPRSCPAQFAQPF